MANSLSNFEKIATDSCSNVYLVDENLCLSKSNEIFNTNFKNVSSELYNLQNYNNMFYEVYTIFSLNSSSWMSAYSNLRWLSGALDSIYATVNTTSSYWAKPFELIYPDFIPLDNWYSNYSIYTGQTIKNWLKTQFPETSYPLNQKIIVDINLFKSIPYPLTFNKAYTETCYVYSYNSASCNGCGMGDVKCNHPDKAGKKDIPGCNLCNNCSITKDSKSITISCQSYTPPKTLTINYNKYVSDNFIPRVVKVKYININNNWTITT